MPHAARAPETTGHVGRVTRPSPSAGRVRNMTYSQVPTGPITVDRQREQSAGFFPTDCIQCYTGLSTRSLHHMLSDKEASIDLHKHSRAKKKAPHSTHLSHKTHKTCMQIETQDAYDPTPTHSAHTTRCKRNTCRDVCTRVQCTDVTLKLFVNQCFYVLLLVMGGHRLVSCTLQ